MASGAMSFAAFPPLEWSDTAWIAWVPLIWVVRRVPLVTAFRYGTIAGAVFWLGSIFWLTEVTWLGWVLLSFYCALYIGLFAVGVRLLFQIMPEDKVLSRVGILFTLPLIWVGPEYLRSVLFTGFAWNPLGLSQFERLSVLQVSSVTGIYGVSALIMVVNAVVFLTIQRYVRDGLRGGRSWNPELMLGLLVLAVTIVWGGRQIRQPLPEGGTELRTALIQPNIPQYQKWTPEFVDHIYAQLERLTTMALRAGQPDWVIWPETAVPDYVRESARSYELVRQLARDGAPLLVGSMDIEWVDEGIPRYYNSSLLFDRDGHLVDAYDKQHLVMFGEYVPLGRFLPFLQAMTPIEASFDAGSESTVMTVPDRTETFAVLICFEDTVATLSRRAVQGGARLLVNQTNNGWFRESIAARQHMIHSVARAAENRVPIVRSANTGVSVGINRFGRINEMIADETGFTFVEGFTIARSHVPPADMPLTIYTRYGDWFAWLGIMVFGLVAWAGRRTLPSSTTTHQTV